MTYVRSTRVGPLEGPGIGITTSLESGALIETTAKTDVWGGK
jgi:hypothetical protein